MASPIPLTWNEALSGIVGTISLAAWVFLLLPQLYENYAQGHAEGISLTFLFIWMVGDLTNLIGAVWAGLVPTVIALAVYFCFADAVLIGQCLWYKWMGRSKSAGGAEEEGGKINGAAVGEETPLLRDGQPSAANGNAQTRRNKRSSFGDVTEENMGLPGSRRRSSAASGKGAHQRTTSDGALNPITELQQPSASSSRAWLKNTVSVLAIILAGTAAWAIAWRVGAWRPTPAGHEEDAGGKGTPLGAEILGYASAVCYLGARIPQIVKNQRERSCEGLSLLFFMLSLLGNATYGAGILFHSVEKQYSLTNLPWLIGSFGTMAEDAIIFAQFHAFANNGAKKDAETEEIANTEAVR